MSFPITNPSRRLGPDGREVGENRHASNLAPSAPRSTRRRQASTEARNQALASSLTIEASTTGRLVCSANWSTPRHRRLAEQGDRCRFPGELVEQLEPDRLGDAQDSRPPYGPRSPAVSSHSIFEGGFALSSVPSSALVTQGGCQPPTAALAHARRGRGAGRGRRGCRARRQRPPVESSGRAIEPPHNGLLESRSPGSPAGRGGFDQPLEEMAPAACRLEDTRPAARQSVQAVGALRPRGGAGSGSRRDPDSKRLPLHQHVEQTDDLTSRVLRRVHANRLGPLLASGPIASSRPKPGRPRRSLT